MTMKKLISDLDGELMRYNVYNKHGENRVQSISTDLNTSHYVILFGDLWKLLIWKLKN